MTSTIFSSIQDPVHSLVAELMRSEEFNEKVTYKRYTGQAFDSDVEYTKNVYDTTKELDAVRMRHTKESVKVSASDVQVGDLLFLFDASAFPSECSLKDLVVDADGNELGVKGIDRILNFAVSVTIVGAK